MLPGSAKAVAGAFSPGTRTEGNCEVESNRMHFRRIQEGMNTKHPDSARAAGHLAGLCILLLVTSAAAEPAELHHMVDREAVASVMEAIGVPGISASVVRGDTQEVVALGSASPDADIDVRPRTIFEAASLSKTVFATMFMEGVSDGEFALDEPLADTTVARRVSDQAMYRMLTPRLILSHQTGLPNWAGDARDPGRTDPLVFEHEPGAAFRYSGEGYELLRAHVEQVSGLSLEANFDKKRRRYGMLKSHFAFDETPTNSAVAKGISPETTRSIPPSPRGLAAASLITSAYDYGHFLHYLLRNESLLDALVTSQVTIEESGDGTISWGLGWGLYERADGSRVAFHWGDNFQFKAFVAIDLDNEIAVVYFANGVEGLKLIGTIVEPVVGELGMVRDWLDYEDD